MPCPVLSRSFSTRICPSFGIPSTSDFLEEDWLFEAITETYIPLLSMMQRLVHDGVPFKLTMSLTPTLCAMLQDELLRERYVRHLERSIDLAQREIEAKSQAPATSRALSNFISICFRESRHFVCRANGNAICSPPFASCAKTGFA